MVRMFVDGNGEGRGVDVSGVGIGARFAVNEMDQNQSSVLMDIRGGVAEIRFNAPARLNVIDPPMAAGFAQAVERVTNTAGVRVIVISGMGRAFMAGGDLDYFNRAADKPAAARSVIEPMHGALKLLAAAPQIVVGSLKGAVAGGGMSIALGLDLVIAADNTVFSMAYARIAASPDCGGSWALPRLVGTRKALEIALLSDDIDAEEALRLGLVNRVVPLAELEAETAALAQRLACGAAFAQGQSKLLIRAAQDRSYDAQLDAEAEAFAACAQQQDFSEALTAFFAKRSPHFQGS